MTVGTSRWVALAQMCLCMLCSVFALQTVSPVLSLMMKEFHLSHHQGGMLVSLFSLPAIFISLPMGMLADRYGIKRVGVASLLLAMAGTAVVATGKTFPILLAGRLVAGAGAVGLLIIAPQGIAQWFVNKEVGVAMGIFNMAGPLGIILSLMGLSAIGSRFGWRSSTWATDGFFVMTLLLFILFYRSAPEETGLKGETALVPRGMAALGLPVWLVGLSWAFFNACLVSLLSFAPDFMVGRGLSLELAGFSTGLAMAGSLVLNPGIGYLMDRTGRKETFVGVGGITMVVLLLLVPGPGNHFALLMLSIGVSIALIPAPLLSLVAEVVHQRNLGLGFGVLCMLNNLGVFVGPQLVGLSRDVSGSYRVGFGLMALFALLTAACVLVVPWLKRKDEAAPVDAPARAGEGR